MARDIGIRIVRGVMDVFLFFVFVILFVVLAALLYVGSLFFQSYIYTEPTPGLAWRAPAMAAGLAIFFTFWAFLVTRSDAAIGSIPYDTVFRFSPKVEMFPEPAPKLWAVKGDGTKILFLRRINDNLLFEYFNERKKPWSPAGIVAIEIDNNGSLVRMEKGEVNEGGYRSFLSGDGWVMQEFDTGPTGIPSQSRWGRFLANLALNGLHAGLWFVGLWLALQFRFNDALGFAFVAWLFMTVAILPMILDQSATVARQRNVASLG